MSRDRKRVAPSRREEEIFESPRRRRPRRKRLLAIPLLLLAAVVAAPTVVTHTPLRAYLLSWAGRKLQLQIEAADISAGWFSSVRLRGVALRDANGQLLLEAAEVHCDRTLLGLLGSRLRLGTIRLQQPVVHLALREDGSNWEDALRPLLQDSGQTAPPSLRLELSEGELNVQDVRQMRSWQFSPFNGQLDLDPLAEKPLTGQLDLVELATEATTQLAQLSLQVQSADPQLRSVQGDLRAQAVPLSALQSLAARLAPDLSLAGQMNLDAAVVWSSSQQPSWQLAIRTLDIRQLHCRFPQLAADDRVQLAQLTGSGGLKWESGALVADDLKLVSEAASMHARGPLRWHPPAAETAETNAPEQLAVAAQIDMARLAEMLPATLRIRSDTRIESGRLTATLSSGSEGAGQRWIGQLRATEIAATTGGRAVRWEQPVQLAADVTQAADGWAVRQLECTSSFLQLNGSGTPAAGKLHFQGDLNRLRSELSQFVHIADAQLQGNVSADLSWQQDQQSQTVQGQLDLRQFALTLAAGSWQEPQLTAAFHGLRRRRETRLSRWDQARLTVHAGSDQLSAELQPPPTGSAPSTWRLAVRGGLDRWLMRAAALAGSPWRGGGELDLQADIAVSDAQIVVAQADLVAKPCQVQGLGLQIDEPQLEAHLRGAYDRSSRRWQGEKTTLISSTVAARCDNLQLQLDPAATLLAGDITYRGDLARIVQAVRTGPAHRQLAGQLEGHAKIHQVDGNTNFELRQRLDGLALLQRLPAPGNSSAPGVWKETWREPFFDVLAIGRFDAADDRIDLEKLEIGAESVQLALQGRLEDWKGRINTSLDGQLKYDLQRLSQKIRPVVGRSLVLEGVSQRPVRLQGPLRGAAAVATTRLASADASGAGPLVPPELTGQASFAWTSATFEGVAVGAGELQSTLQGSRVQFEAIDLAVSQGRIRLSPRIDLTTSIPVLQAPGQLERLQISPEMCSTWLKYVAPMLADAARIEGSLSANIQQLNVPWTMPHRSTADGSLQIHSGRAGPGPLAQQLLLAVRQAEKAFRTARQGGGNPLKGGRMLDNALEALGGSGPLLDKSGQLNSQRAGQALQGLLGSPPAGSPGPQRPAEDWVLLPEQSIGFQMRDGRVYHQGMQLLIDDVPVRTSGSVGLDQTLSITAEIQVIDKWLGDSPWLAAFKGQAIRVPVSGTLRQPRVDPRALQQVGQQLLQGGVGGAVQNAAGSELEKALRGIIGN